MSLEEISSVRFGVYLQGRGLRDWEWKSVELLRGDGASCLFIIAPPDAAPRRSKVARALDDLILRIADLPAGSRAELGEPDPERYRPSTVCTVERTIAAQATLSPAQRRELSAHRLKFILFFGGGEIPDGLAGCAELGVWRFTRSSGAAGEYPFIHGLHRRDDVVSFGLEQIGDQADHRRVLLNGHFRARGERNRTVVAQVLSEAGRWPLRALKHGLLNGELPCSMESDRADGGPRSSPVLLVSLLARDILQRLSSKLASYLVLETWNVGFVRMNFQALLAGAPLSDVSLLPRRELGRYIADPFILSTTPELTLLAEDYTDFGVGRISEVTVREPFGTPEVGLKVRLESRHHMSYPFLFREEGITYCLPECHQSNASLLYRYDAGKLTPVTDLVTGVRVTDGTILFHDGLYWLFCGLENDNDQVNLHLFFSKTLRGNWSPHPLNPVKTDVRSSRSAGPVIVHDGALFRPAQDCSRSYGYGLAINRIDRLTVTRFEETLITTIRPEAISRSCKGLHTLSFAGDLMVIDAKFHLIGFEPILVRALRRMKRMTGRLSRTIRLWSQSA
ncbi:hypothetical protein [Enhydrobacter sp.]|jgi:hypothetical protein|uniref:glucosamine inositolphosphorylceramide transferase family protein n=1 Tax=Enhydrobacter sp. TaxID=1894999 RepID=UPI002609D773|nr:hypothetical protein [Enhydrobacter sp.]WIM12908.1 MAG: hypothetical protein OJF58_003871 [Enhydrobacter sp.]